MANEHYALAHIGNQLVAINLLHSNVNQYGQFHNIGRDFASDERKSEAFHQQEMWHFYWSRFRRFFPISNDYIQCQRTFKHVISNHHWSVLDAFEKLDTAV